MRPAAMTPQPSEGRIRVSCGALCRILVGGRLLVEINKNRGDEISPIGGAIAFDPVASKFLRELQAELECSPDLRLSLPKRSLEDFKEWFMKRIERDVDPERELHEELIAEHRLPISSEQLDLAATVFVGCTNLIAMTNRKGAPNVLTHYYFEVFEVCLPEPLQRQVERSAAEASSRLRLLRVEQAKGAADEVTGLPLAPTVALVEQVFLSRRN